MKAMILICIYIGAPSGQVRRHTLTPIEQQRIDRFETSIDDTCEACDSEYKRLRKLLESDLCRESFGRKPNSTWLEGAQ